MASCILCASYIFSERISQTLINYSFKEKFFYINQAKNFFSYVLKLVFVSIELLRKSDAGVADRNVTEHVLCKEDEEDKEDKEDREVYKEEEEEEEEEEC